MSGGVDSSLAAALLVEQGFEVTGLFMRMGVSGPEQGDRAWRHTGCCSAADANDARLVAGKLGIPFFSLDFKEGFDALISDFADEYARGRTPNPCVTCNRQLKFGRLLEYARAIGAAAVATGHYARIDRTGVRPRLLRSVDRTKDQSYVLFGLGVEALKRTEFPIGHLTKDQVRRMALERGLPVHDKPDSTDICFAPDGDYARVVRERRPDAFVPGDVRDETGRTVGRHRGLPNYTIGQRRGLRIAMGVPVYVTEIDAGSNTVRVGPRDRLFRGGLEAADVQWLSDPPALPIRAEVQIRYTHKAAPATVEPLANGRVRVRFDVPQPAITPGQAAVLYAGDEVLGGGWIESACD